MANRTTQARLVRLCPEQWAMLDAMAETTNKPMIQLVRQAVADFTNVPDSASSHRRHRRRTKRSKT